MANEGNVRVVTNQFSKPDPADVRSPRFVISMVPYDRYLSVKIHVIGSAVANNFGRDKYSIPFSPTFTEPLSRVLLTEGALY